MIVRTAEYRRKQSLAQRGKHHKPLSPEALRNLSKAMKGRVFSEEHKRKIAEALKGKKHTEERKRHQSEAAVRRALRGHSRVSKSGTLFLDTIEGLYEVKIEREFNIAQSFFDGRYGQVLIEVDGQHWHEQHKVNDTFKTYLARTRGYKLYRFIVNNTDEVEGKILEYKNKLEEIFGAKK